MNNKTKQFLLGFRDSIPLMIAAAPFGLVFGALAQSNGLSVWATLGMSAIVFAGASQFVAVTLMGAGVLAPVILFTVFIVNLRHMLYSVSLMPQVTNLPFFLRAIMSFWLTDETYAVVSNKLLRDKRDKDQISSQNFTWFYLGSAIPFYLSWVSATALGILMGQKIPQLTEWGLDIAMVVAFVGIVVPILKNKAQWACAVTAFFSSLLTYSWPHQSGLLFSSLVAILVGVLLSRKNSGKSVAKAVKAVKNRELV